jgi:hypothetical protein
LKKPSSFLLGNEEEKQKNAVTPNKIIGEKKRSMVLCEIIKEPEEFKTKDEDDDYGENAGEELTESENSVSRVGIEEIKIEMECVHSFERYAYFIRDAVCPLIGF